MRLRNFFPLMLGAGATACSSDGPTAAAARNWYFPSTDATWQTARPAEAGFDSAALSSALAWAGDQNSAAVVVVWRGRIIMERYWQGWNSQTPGRFFSAGKTITAALTLDLIHDGAVALDAPVSTYLDCGSVLLQQSRVLSGFCNH